MKVKKCFKERIKQSFLGYFFAFLMMISGGLGLLGVTGVENVYAEPDTTEVVDDTTITDESVDENTSDNTGETKVDETKTDESNKTTLEENRKKGLDNCQKQLESIGWLVCPTTGKLAEAVDWIYNTIEELLVVNPVEARDGAPIYEIWKYCRAVTNIVFIIFLLVVIYSQITGVGISDYGVKKALPKLIVAAVLINLSFLICQLGIDVSNAIGNSLRGLFTGVQESVMATMEISPEAVDSMNMAYSELYGALAGGSLLALGIGVVSFENGTIWLLIPVVLGAIVAVASGLITIALRQAVVALLVMVAPLAIVANILPNTEKLFKKWKDLLIQMLVFYPMFSLLFGASSLAGFAIIASAKDAFWLILGIAVQVFPLFFSWSLMKMSGNFLGTINAKIRGFTAKPLANSRAWAESRRQATRAKHLASGRVYTPSLALTQFLSNRKIAREAEMAENQDVIKNRGLAYNVAKKYKKGVPTKEAEEEYEAQARNMEYIGIVERHKNNMNRGLGQLEAVRATSAEKRARLARLDSLNVQASDRLKMEKARGEVIEYENAVGFHNRMEDAVNAHFDSIHKDDVDKNGKSIYKVHNISDRDAAIQRYQAANSIMEGNLHNTQYAAAVAAQAYDTQKKIVEAKMGKYFEYTPPTRDVEYRLGELTRNANAIANIDSIVAGLRILNQRGDTDLLKQQLDNVLEQGVRLGTHASQSLASFLMFEVKDNDPFLRRFGKYINLETANAYNKNNRQVMDITYDEYIKGYHDGEPATEQNKTGRMYAKKSMRQLMEGTSLDNIERTALSNFDESLKKAYGFDENQKGKAWDIKGYLKKREEIQTAIEPAFLSASLKWLSGSEQISSGVKFWTGYELKQRKDKDGNVVLDGEGKNKNPIYDLSPVWEGEEFAGHEEEVKEYFRKKTNEYFKDQTTGQILGMRTDYRDPTMEHLLESYLSEDSESETSSEKRRKFEKEKSDIQTRYGDKEPEEAKKLREKDLHALKMELAGRQIRKILGETGKLKQIYRTRTSGTAINAKDWLRKWVNLDDEDALRKEMNYYDEKRKKEKLKTESSDADDDTRRGKSVYTDSDRELFLSEMQNLKDRIMDEEPMLFFEDTRAQLETWFGEDSVIAKKYEEYFYKDRPYADNLELYEYLKELLADESNYPDA